MYRVMLHATYIMSKMSFMYRTLKLIILMQSFFVSYDALLSLAKYICNHCTNGYRKTSDCIRVNCDVYVETSRIKDLFRRIANMSQYVLSRFFYVFFLFVSLSMFILYGLYFNGIEHDGIWRLWCFFLMTFSISCFFPSMMELATVLLSLDRFSTYIFFYSTYFYLYLNTCKWS